MKTLKQNKDGFFVKICIFSLLLVIPVSSFVLLNNPRIKKEYTPSQSTDDTSQVLGVTTPAIPAPTGTEWQLKFSDEFDGTTLDKNKWEPSWFTGDKPSIPVNSMEDSCYDPAQVSVSGGSLKLTAATTTKTNCKTRSAQAQYASGLVNTRLSYTFTYGYVEARMYLPGSNGKIHNWPAFWTDGTGTWPKTGEIDVMEGLEDNEACWHYHYADSSGKHQSVGGCPNLADHSGWHVFAANWEPGKITFYYDGVKVGEVTKGVISVKHFIILNHAINDEYGIHVPSTVEVDYVRVWQSVTSTGTTPPPAPPPPPASAICGNGTKEGSEVCDDGNTSNNDQCSSNCSNSCTSPATWNGTSCVTPTTAVCGNGTKEGSEVCDDGNTSNNDQCSSNCSNSCTLPLVTDGSKCIAKTNPKCKEDYNANKITDLNDFALFARNYKRTVIDCALDLVGDNCYLDENDLTKFTSTYKDLNLCQF